MPIRLGKSANPRKDREGNGIIANQQAEIFLLTSQIQKVNDQLDKMREAFEKEER